MKQFKKLIACVLAATLVLGSTTVAWGAQSEKAEFNGSGEFEGTVNKEVFSVQVPTETVSSDVFDFILDPEELIKTTSGSAYEGVTFGAYGTMYFKTGANKYDVNSQTLTAENKSSVDVNVTLQATVTAPDTKVTYVTDNAWTVSDEGLEVYLAVEEMADQSKTAIADKDGNNYTTTVTSSLTKYDIYKTIFNATKGAYEYVIDSAKESTTSPSTYAFRLTGECNKYADWSGYTREAKLGTIKIVWKVEMEGAESLNTTDINGGDYKFDYSKKNGVTVPYTVANDSVTIESFMAGESAAECKTNAQNFITLNDDNTFTFKNAWTSLANDTVRYLQVKFSDDTIITLELKWVD